MDPNATLANALRCADRIADDKCSDSAGRSTLEYDANSLAQAVYALHDWMRRGGFLPEAWKR